MHWMEILVYEPLVATLGEIDLELAAIERAISRRDCDPLILLEDAETFIGDGFLACQLYMTERKGVAPSWQAFACGPRFKSQYVAQIVNAAGNYRTHRGEWHVIRRAGVLDDDFRLVRLLEQLCAPAPPRFNRIIPLLGQWHEAFDQLDASAARCTRA